MIHEASRFGTPKRKTTEQPLESKVQGSIWQSISGARNALDSLPAGCRKSRALIGPRVSPTQYYFLFSSKCLWRAGTHIRLIFHALYNLCCNISKILALPAQTRLTRNRHYVAD